ncbi:DNA mismatch repair protein MutS [Stappia sp. 22II-S9-Z10]|nr:DNA mismatch repair protein MutS [Stappia sp. 22II-S9-Z10]
MAAAVWSDAEIASATPMTAQYLTIKAQNPDGIQFHRMGEVYAMEDAELAAKALFIHCTTRGTHAGQAWLHAGSTRRPS